MKAASRRPSIWVLAQRLMDCGQARSFRDACAMLAKRPRKVTPATTQPAPVARRMPYADA